LPIRETYTTPPPNVTVQETAESADTAKAEPQLNNLAKKTARAATLAEPAKQAIKEHLTEWQKSDQMPVVIDQIIS
jgi:hypothetical protein